MKYFECPCSTVYRLSKGKGKNEKEAQDMGSWADQRGSWTDQTVTWAAAVQLQCDIRACRKKMQLQRKHEGVSLGQVLVD